MAFRTRTYSVESMDRLEKSASIGRKRGESIAFDDLCLHHPDEVCSHQNQLRRPSASLNNLFEASKKAANLFRRPSLSMDNLLDIGRKGSIRGRPRKQTIDSQPFFKMVIQTLDGEENLEKVMIEKKKLLGEAVDKVLRCYRLNVLDFDLFLDGSHSPLAHDTDIRYLQGGLIHAVQKEPGCSRKAEKRNSTSGNDNESNSNTASHLSSAIVMKIDKKLSSVRLNLGKKRVPVYELEFPDKDTSPLPRNRTRLNQVFSPDQERLNEQLSVFSNNGIPPNPSNILQNQIDLPLDLIVLESSWEDVVDNSQDIPLGKETKQQAAMWELLQTEVNFIKQIKAIIDVHVSCFYELHSDFFSEVPVVRLFSNLDEVYNANCFFWKEYLSRPLQHSRGTGERLKPSLLKEGFLEVTELLRPYSRFCIEMSTCRRYLQKLEKDNQVFATFLQWASGVNLTNREGLCDQLAKPFQRLTKYRPILESIRKYTVDEDDLADIDLMLTAVNEFVQQINDEVRRHEMRNRLEALDARLDGYDVVEVPSEECARLAEEFSHFSLTRCLSAVCGGEGRTVVFEGPMRLKEGQSKSTDVFCILCSDLFLITKSSKKNSERLKIIRSPIRLDKLAIRKMSGGGAFACVVLNDFCCLCALYLLSAEPAKVEEWLLKIRQTKKTFTAALGESCSLTSYDDELDIPTVQVISSSPRLDRGWSEYSAPSGPLSPCFSRCSTDPEEAGLGPELRRCATNPRTEHKCSSPLTRSPAMFPRKNISPFFDVMEKEQKVDKEQRRGSYSHPIRPPILLNDAAHYDMSSDSSPDEDFPNESLPGGHPRHPFSRRNPDRDVTAADVIIVPPSSGETSSSGFSSTGSVYVQPTQEYLLAVGENDPNGPAASSSPTISASSPRQGSSPHFSESSGDQSSGDSSPPNSPADLRTKVIHTARPRDAQKVRRPASLLLNQRPIIAFSGPSQDGEAEAMKPKKDTTPPSCFTEGTNSLDSLDLLNI